MGQKNKELRKLRREKKKLELETEEIGLHIKELDEVLKDGR